MEVEEVDNRPFLPILQPMVTRDQHVRAKTRHRRFDFHRASQLQDARVNRTPLVLKLAQKAKRFGAGLDIWVVQGCADDKRDARWEIDWRRSVPGVRNYAGNREFEGPTGSGEILRAFHHLPV